MNKNKLLQRIIVVMSLFLLTFSAFALEQFSPTIQIYTQFHYFFGKPTWLLIVRDVDTGLVSPYIFDIRNNENYWIAFTYGHNYRVTVSQLTFGTYAKVDNFCGLQDGILSGMSLYMVLNGVLTPDPRTVKCVVRFYKNVPFTVVK